MTALNKKEVKELKRMIKKLENDPKAQERIQKGRKKLLDYLNKLGQGRKINSKKLREKITI